MLLPWMVDVFLRPKPCLEPIAVQVLQQGMFEGWFDGRKTAADGKSMRMAGT